MPFGIINNYYNNRVYRNQLNMPGSSISHSRRGGGKPYAANSSRRRSGSMRNWRKKMNCAGCSGETVQIIKNVDKCCSKNIKNKRRKNFINNAHSQNYHFSSNSYLKRRGKTYEKMFQDMLVVLENIFQGHIVIFHSTRVLPTSVRMEQLLIAVVIKYTIENPPI